MSYRSLSFVLEYTVPNVTINMIRYASALSIQDRIDQHVIVVERITRYLSAFFLAVFRAAFEFYDNLHCKMGRAIHRPPQVY